MAAAFLLPTGVPWGLLLLSVLLGILTVVGNLLYLRLLCLQFFSNPLGRGVFFKLPLFSLSLPFPFLATRFLARQPIDRLLHRAKDVHPSLDTGLPERSRRSATNSPFPAHSLGGPLRRR